MYYLCLFLCCVISELVGDCKTFRPGNDPSHHPLPGKATSDDLGRLGDLHSCPCYGKLFHGNVAFGIFPRFALWDWLVGIVLSAVKSP